MEYQEEIGYGEQNLSMKDAMKISEKLNEKYERIENAIEEINPLLGLLSDGNYMIADYDLFPCVGEKHFWEFHAIPDLFTAWSSYINQIGKFTTKFQKMHTNMTYILILLLQKNIFNPTVIIFFRKKCILVLR